MSFKDFLGEEKGKQNSAAQLKKQQQNEKAQEEQKRRATLHLVFDKVIKPTIGEITLDFVEMGFLANQSQEVKRINYAYAVDLLSITMNLKPGKLQLDIIGNSMTGLVDFTFMMLDRPEFTTPVDPAVVDKAKIEEIITLYLRGLSDEYGGL